MKTLKNKMKNKKGFTLMEMLIVVAIMVVLIALAIPSFSEQLDNAKATVDDANLRVAKEIASSMYMLKQNEFKSIMYFDKDAGTFVSESPSPYGQSESNSQKVISAQWNEDTKKIEIRWVEVE